MIKISEISSVNRPRAAAGAAYDRMSRRYDIMTGPAEMRYRKAGLKMLKPLSGENILEIGCGTGNSAVFIAKSVVPDGKYTGFDISEKMLAKSKKKLAAKGLISLANLVCGDAYAMPFLDGMFDAVFMSFTLELFDTPDISVVLSECKRVIKPSGRLIVVAMSKTIKRNNMVSIYEWMHRKLPDMVDCRPIFVEAVLVNSGFRVGETKKMWLAGIPVVVAEGFLNSME